MARKTPQENIDAYLKMKEQLGWEELARELKILSRALEKINDAISRKNSY